MQPTTVPREIPQSGDLCGGTGGNGQIVSVGNNEFTIKLNADGSDMVVHLTGRATIKTSAGSASLSDLKIGYRVTLVGGPNPDGSFTADNVVVCNGIVP
jgi:pectate lyase